MALSIVDQNFINLAANEAQKSNVSMKHGCVAVASGKVIGRGCNACERTHSRDKFIKNSCSCHAEMAALRNVYHSCTTTHGNYIDSIKGAWSG